MRQVRLASIIGGAIVSTVMAIIVIIGIVAIYSIVWLSAYPLVGEYCSQGGTVKESVLDGTFWGGNSRYKVTMEDGTQAYTSYVAKGSYYCAESHAHYNPLKWGDK